MVAQSHQMWRESWRNGLAMWLISYRKGYNTLDCKERYGNGPSIGTSHDKNSFVIGVVPFVGPRLNHYEFVEAPIQQSNQTVQTEGEVRTR